MVYDGEFLLVPSLSLTQVHYQSTVSKKYGHNALSKKVCRLSNQVILSNVPLFLQIIMLEMGQYYCYHYYRVFSGPNPTLRAGFFDVKLGRVRAG